LLSFFFFPFLFAENKKKEQILVCLIVEDSAPSMWLQGDLCASVCYFVFIFFFKSFGKRDLVEMLVDGGAPSLVRYHCVEFGFWQLLIAP
jgi:hypothetical protein